MKTLHIIVSGWQHSYKFSKPEARWWGKAEIDLPWNLSYHSLFKEILPQGTTCVVQPVSRGGYSQSPWKRGARGAGGVGDLHILTAFPEKPFPIKMVLYFFALHQIFGRSAGIQPSQGLGFDAIVLLRHCCLYFLDTTYDWLSFYLFKAQSHPQGR